MTAPALLQVTLRSRIQSALVRIVHLYVVASVALLGLMAMGISGYEAYSRLGQERDLVVTKLTADLTNLSRQIRTLSGSSLLWTGLTDSFGREAYLEPLLSRFNEEAGSTMVVLDYRGRRFLGPQNERADLIVASQTVRRAVSQEQAAYGVLRGRAGTAITGDVLVLVQPVLSPQSASPVGYVLADLDPRASLGGLPLRRDLEIRLDAKETTDTAPQTPTLTPALRLNGRLDVGQGPHAIRQDLAVSHTATGAVARGAAMAVVIGALGLALAHHVRRWSRQFAASTTQRLETLVATCRDILDGKPARLGQDDARDDIGAVFEALHKMLQHQQDARKDLQTAAKVFDTSGEAILVTDGAGHIVASNPAAAAMTGFSKEELGGMRASVLYRDAETTAVSAEIRRTLAAGGVWRGETAFRHRDGRMIPAYVAMSRLEDPTGTPAPAGVVSVISDITPLKLAQEQLRDLAYKDSLTGLPNFRALTEALAQRVHAHDARAHPFLVVFFDMDHLKQINDTHGHEVGDAVIKHLAEHLQAGLPPGHLLCRRSGDEFVAIVDVPDRLELPLLRYRLSQRLTRFELDTPSGTTTVSVSAGVARFPDDATTVQDLLIRADETLYRVKQQGRAAIGWA
jgi:diguanylate cyclase (GGDEF)-like protein/PAS domain S-box-containing protein